MRAPAQYKKTNPLTGGIHMKLLKKLFSKTGALALMALTALAALPVAVGAAPVTSAPIDFSTSTGIAVSPTDVVTTGFSFANMFGPFTMLILGAIFAPVGIGFVIWLMRKLPKFGGSKS